MKRPGARWFDVIQLIRVLVISGAFWGNAAAVQRGVTGTQGTAGWVVAHDRAASPTMFTLQRGERSLRLRFYASGIVRVTYGEHDAQDEPENPMLVPDAKAGLAGVSKTVIAVHQGISQDGLEDTFSTDKVSAHVARRTGSVRFLDSQGELLLAESREPGARQFKESRHEGSGFEVTQIFLPKSGEKFYGLGQHQSGVWNYSGESVELRQDNTQISIPFFYSSRGYGVLWNNGGVSRFNSSFAQRLYMWSRVASTIDYFFIAGPEADDVIAGYRRLTGAAPMFSLSAYGLWQSKNRYKSADELLAAARRYRQEKIPVDNLVEDWFWWTKMGSHQFTEEFPDPKGMVDTLHALHFHVMLSVWPFFQPGSENYDAYLKRNLFIYSIPTDSSWMPGAALYDAFSSAGRSLYWQQIRDSLYSKGFDAWWQDVTEPETLDREDNAMQTANDASGRLDCVANLYPLMTTSAIYEGQRAENDEKRVFLLTRSGSAGMQRNAAVAWSGDLFSTWESLRRQIPAGLNYSISGLPYWTTDIGGFVSGNPDDPAYRELFVRWFEYGTFCPIFRVHGTRDGNRNELWSYGSEVQGILTKFDHLRYRLLPYIYSTAWQVTQQGSTMMRPLVMDFRTDENATSIGDQFLFGPSLLVSPVTHSAERSRHLYLPGTGGWTNFWSGSRLHGGSFHDEAAPLNTIPLFVRDGSIMVLGPELQYAKERLADPLEVRVFAGEDADFTLYEDEGDSYRYEQGRYATIGLHWDESKQVLTIGSRTGAFAGMLRSRTLRIVWVRPGHGVGEEMEGRPDRLIHYDGQEIKVSRR